MPPRGPGTLKPWGGLRVVLTAWAMTAGSFLLYKLPDRSNHAVQAKHEQPDQDLVPKGDDLELFDHGNGIFMDSDGG